MFSKKEIRKEALKARKQLSEREIQHISDKILSFFTLLNFAECKTLHIFLPISAQNEINTWQMVDFIRKNHPHITLVVSRSDFKTFTMEHFILEASKIELSAWGIPEPNAAATPFYGKIDWVLVPLLAFDKKGFRVGYGKGFYDRFLENTAPKPWKIGVCHSPLSVDIVDIDAHDEVLDICITPEGIINFSSEN